jgi:hypothetical protein
MTYRAQVSLAVVVVLSFVSHAAAQSPARVTAADGRADVSDPAGDVEPIVYRVSVGDGPEKEVKYPGFDVVKLAVESDGKALTFAATLTAAPARAAYEVLEFHVDADNNPKTGVTHPDAPKLLTGLEYYGTLDACLEHNTFGTMCAGTEDKPSGFSAIVTLEKYGKEWMFKDALYDLPAAGKVKEPRKTPIAGPLVRASVDYSALGVKSGQTIRLVVREYSAGKVDNVPRGYFPEIVLTLK